LPYQPPQSRLEHILYPGMISSELCPIAFPQIRRVRETGELGSGRLPQLQRPCQRLAINRRSRSLTQYG
jgi:hypothetical protein